MVIDWFEVEYFSRLLPTDCTSDIEDFGSECENIFYIINESFLYQDKVWLNNLYKSFIRITSGILDGIGIFFYSALKDE